MIYPRPNCLTIWIVIRKTKFNDICSCIHTQTFTVITIDYHFRVVEYFYHRIQTWMEMINHPLQNCMLDHLNSVHQRAFWYYFRSIVAKEDNPVKLNKNLFKCFVEISWRNNSSLDVHTPMIFFIYKTLIVIQISNSFGFNSLITAEFHANMFQNCNINCSFLSSSDYVSPLKHTGLNGINKFLSKREITAF